MKLHQIYGLGIYFCIYLLRSIDISFWISQIIYKESIAKLFFPEKLEYITGFCKVRVYVENFDTFWLNSIFYYDSHFSTFKSFWNKTSD